MAANLIAICLQPLVHVFYVVADVEEKSESLDCATQSFARDEIDDVRLPAAFDNERVGR
jgi:hypothetical protein